MRSALLALLLVLGAAAPAAAQWGEPPPVELGRGQQATCLRDTGGGRVAALAQRGQRYGAALYTVAADALHPDGDVLLGRALAACPEVAANADGAAAVAVPVERRHGRRPPSQHLLVAVRDRGGAFAPPVELARLRTSDGWIEPVVAVAADGSVLVAWREPSATEPDGRGHVTIRAARRAPGGSFEPAQTLVDRADGGLQTDVGVAVGFDAAGAATLALARPLPPRRGGAIDQLASVEVATAAPGAPFGAPAVVTAESQDVGALALAVAPDGGALLAHDGNERVRVLERAPGESAFALRARFGGGLRSSPSLPSVALAPDGGAVVAWRDLGAVDAVARAGAGAFAPVTRLQPPSDDGRGLGWTEYASPGPPSDVDDGRPRVAAAPGGHAAVAWLESAGVPGWSTRPLVAPSAGARFAPAVVLGSPVRDAGAALPRLDAGGPGAVWTDNAADRSAGRLRLAHAARPPARLAAPRVTATARPQALFHSEPLVVDVRCAAACDLRAIIAPRRPASGDEAAPAPAVGNGGRRDAGRVRVRVMPQFWNHVAPPRGGQVRVVVHATAPGGTDASRTAVAVPVRRRPLPPLRAPLDVRARRAGTAVVVTWRTAGPARRMWFLAFTRRTRGRSFTRASASRYVRGRGRHRFRVRLEGARRARYVVVHAAAQDPPSRLERVVVPVR